MTHPPHGWPAWQQPSPCQPPPQYHQQAMPTDSFALAMALGRIEAASERQTEILLAINDRLIDLPDRIADRLPPQSTSPPPVTPPAAPSLKLGTIREWILAVTALGGLIAVLTGKITWSELFELSRKLAGV